MFKHLIKWLALGSLLTFSSANAIAQIRPPDISQSTASTWVWRGKTKFGSGTPVVTQTEGSMYVSGILESNNAVYFKGISSTGQIMWINSSGQVNVVTLGSGLSFNTGTSTLTATGTIGGSGTTDYAARWTGTGTLGTGVIRDDGTHAAVGTAPTSDALTVSGQVTATTFSGSGASLTSIPATGLASGGTFPAINGSALTALNGSNIASGTVGVGVGGTGLTSYTIGDLPYASGTSTLAKLADVATGSVLVSGGVTTAPAWSSTPTVTSLTATTNTVSSDIQWTGGRVTYVPLAGSLSTYITNATAGDTLVLGSGTYTTGSTLTVAKALTFVGQGMDKTILLCNGAVTNWSVTASNVTFKDLTLQNSSTSSTMIVDGTAGTILTGIRFNNVKFEETNTTTNVTNLQTIDSIVDAKNCQFVSTGASSSTIFYNIRIQANSTAEGPVTATFTNCSSVVNAINSSTVSGVYELDNSTTNPVNLVWRQGYVEVNNTGAGAGNGFLTFGGDVNLFTEDGYVTAKTTDIANGTGNAWTRSTTLAENTTSGSVYGQGTSRVANVAPYVSVAAPTYKNDLYLANIATLGSEISTNGDMESAVSTVGATNANTAATFAQSTTQVHAGTNSGALTATSTAVAYRQMGSITELVAGKTYAVSVWVYNPSSGGAANNVQLYGVYSTSNLSPDVATTTTKDAWVQLSILFTVPKTGIANTYLRIIMNSIAISSVTYWDDFTVKQVTDGDVYANDGTYSGALAVTGAITGASVTSTGAVSGTTITGSGIVTGSGLKATGLLSATSLATDGSGNVIFGSASSGRAPGVTKVVAASNSVSTTGADYICTGTDDQTLINTALAAAGGGSVVLLEGTYTLGNGAGGVKNIVMSVSNTHLKGVSRKGVIINRGYNPSSSVNGPMILVSSGVLDTSISDMYIDAKKATFTNANGEGIRYAGSGNGLTVSNVEIVNSKSNGVHVVSGSTLGRLRDVYVNSADAEGILFDSSSNEFWFDDVRVTGGTKGIALFGTSTNTMINHPIITGGSNNGIYLNGCTKCEINNPEVNNSDIGIYITGGSDNSVSGGTLSNATSSALLVSTSPRTRITGVEVTTSAGIGFDLGGSGGTSIDALQIVGNTIYTPSGHGISIAGVSNSLFSSNYIYNAAGVGSSDGINLGSNSDNNQIIGNKIIDTAGTGSAIEIQTGCDTNFLADNIFNGTGATSITDTPTNTIWSHQWDGTNFVTKGGESRFKRVDASAGATTVVLGDVALSGWGTGASVAITAGSTDLAGSMTITAGTTPSANPTATLTYKDGAFKDSSGTNQAPFFMATWNTGSTGAAAQIGTSMTATTGVVTYMATPVNASTYIINWHTIGGK